HAVETRDIRWSVFSGIAAGVALLGGYQSVFLFAGVGVAALIHPERGAYLRPRSPWTTTAAAIVVLAPHVDWLYQHDFAPLSTVVSQHVGAPFGEVLRGVAAYVGGGLAG